MTRTFSVISFCTNKTRVDGGHVNLWDETTVKKDTKTKRGSIGSIRPVVVLGGLGKTFVYVGITMPSVN